MFLIDHRFDYRIRAINVCFRDLSRDHDDKKKMKNRWIKSKRTALFYSANIILDF